VCSRLHQEAVCIGVQPAFQFLLKSRSPTHSAKRRL
jgi:hypothetical protein